MAKHSKSDRAEAIARLREWIKPGDTVYTILESVSRSGMSRAIRVLIPTIDGIRDGQGRGTATVDFIHPNHAVSVALNLRRAKSEGVIMGGCGMDMGFALVYELSHTLYPEYQCLGKGKCPSNYHVNHRDRVRCEGVTYGEDRHHCYRPDPFSRWPVADDWPIQEETVTVDGDDGQPISHTFKRYLACISYESIVGLPVGTKDLCLREDGSAIQVCPTCQGKGDLPNPEGPERWDLLHTDGYALRHRWL